MSNRYGPRIVTDGLVCCLDAADKNSYAAAGNITWTDISGNGNNGTLTNGPTFSSINGGSIVFDGSNDYVVLSDVFESKAITVSAMIYPTANAESSSDADRIVSRDRSDYWMLGQFGTNYQVEWTVYTAGAAYQSFSPNNSIILNTWQEIVGNYDNVTGAMKIFKNGSLIYNTTIPTSNSNIGNGSSRQIAIGSNVEETVSVNRLFNGRISNIKIYNKALSDDEILQNYNATKGRFGL